MHEDVEQEDEAGGAGVDDAASASTGSSSGVRASESWPAVLAASSTWTRPSPLAAAAPAAVADSRTTVRIVPSTGA